MLSAKRRLAFAAALSLLPFLGAPAVAQKLSDRAIVILVPFTPGTGIDVLARIVGEELKQRWNQPVIVENKPGASGNIGTQAASRAEPDGHTIMMTVNTFVMNASLFKSLPYDPLRSFEPIVEVATGALALAVHPSIEAKSVKELIAQAKTKPGEITYASPGRGTPQHLAMELFKLTAGVDLKHVPYAGSAGAVRDLVGGHVKAMFIPVHTVLPLAHDNQVRVLAVGSDKRSAMAREVPTLAEEGVTGFDVDLWYGLLAPAGTPKEIVERYNAAVNEILATPKVKESLAVQGLIPVGGPPQRFGELIARDMPRWAKVVKDSGITVD